MPPPNSWRDTSDPYHAAHFQHDAQRQVVICPQKRELPLQRIRKKEGKQVEVYRSAQVCKDCQCTTDRHGRSIDIQGHAALVETHRRWNEPATAELYELRAPTIEPVFAQFKQNHGFRRFTHRGLQKVKAQWAMLCAIWNTSRLLALEKAWSRRPRPFRPAPPALPVVYLGDARLTWPVSFVATPRLWDGLRSGALQGSTRPR
jgi:hypothetical protein